MPDAPQPRRSPMRPLQPAADAAAPAGPTQSADALAQALGDHQAALRERFPLPDLERLAREAAERAGRRRRRLGLGALAALAVAAGLWGLDPAYRSERFETAIGGPREVTLADGSRLTLDTSTRLSVDWHLRSRRATLDQGRVLLQVAHAALRPFQVQAGRARVRVTGTRFEVERHGGDVAVYLDQGVVEVALAARLPGEPDRYRLRPGMALDLGAQRPARARGTPPPDPLAWAHGELVFEGVRLDDALARLQRYVAQPIRLADPTLAGLQVSGVFRVAQAQAMLDLLPLVGPMAVRRGEDGAIVVERRAP